MKNIILSTIGLSIIGAGLIPLAASAEEVILTNQTPSSGFAILDENDQLVELSHPSLAEKPEKNARAVFDNGNGTWRYWTGIGWGTKVGDTAVHHTSRWHSATSIVGASSQRREAGRFQWASARAEGPRKATFRSYYSYW